MASLLRPVWRTCVLQSTSTGCRIAKRQLFSEEILGVDNFKRFRIFHRDMLSDRQGFVDKLSHSRQVNQVQSKHVVHDLVKLIYVAERGQEVSLVTDLLKQLYANEEYTQTSSPDAVNGNFGEEGPWSPRNFQFGPLVFRLLHILKAADTAVSLYSDKELKPLFLNATCHLLLMDMLYEGERYYDVIHTFAVQQDAAESTKFAANCTTCILAALYRLNTAESYQEMKRMVEEAKAEERVLSRRSFLFAAALALRQGDPLLALNIAESVRGSNQALFRNIKMMALAQLGRLDEVLSTMEDGTSSKVHLSFRTGTIYSDAAKIVTDSFATSQPAMKTRLEKILSTLEAEGLLCPQTVEHFVTRPVLHQNVAKSSHSFKKRFRAPVKTLK